MTVASSSSSLSVSDPLSQFTETKFTMFAINTYGLTILGPVPTLASSVFASLEAHIFLPVP